MTVQRSSFLLLLVAACLALVASPAFSEPAETPPGAPPAGDAAETPDGLPPGAAEEVVEVLKAAPGRLPNTDGPKIPNIIGQVPHQANQAVSAWRIRVEHVVTDAAFVGRVVDQHPDAGTTLAAGEVLTLVVGIPTMPSRGHTSVPKIEGLKLEAGVAALRDKGFDVMLRAAESYDRDKGVVIAQAPRPASVAARGQKVVVLVGKGGLAEPVVPVVVPDPVPAAPMPAPAEEPTADEPPAGPPPIPAGPPPTAEVPVIEEPAAPAMPAEAPPALPQPPTEEPPTPMPPAEEPPTPMPTAPAVEDPPAPVPVPVPVETPKSQPVLRVPTLASPSSGQTFPRAFGSTFKWGGVSNAKAYEWELQVEAKDGTWSTATTETVEGTTFRPKRLEAGRYRWRVRAVAGDVAGNWSEFRTLFLY